MRWYVCTKRRSIQSFHSHTQAPLSAQPLRVAIAYLPPALISASACGEEAYGLSAWPASARRRVLPRGAPWRTANTPDVGRGCPVTLAQSPAAKTAGCHTDCRQGL